MESTKKVKANSITAAYSGSVKVKVVDRKGRQVGKTKHFKNNGRWPLFQFFTACLTGSYDNAEPLRPQYVNIFHAGAVGDPEPEISESGGDISKYANEDSKKNYVTYTYSSAPEITTIKSKYLGSSAITYSFLIPFAHINNAEAINMICLYNKQEYTEYGQPSAFFFVSETDEFGDKYLSSLLDEANTTKKNYNLIIEWTLTIQNEEKTDSATESGD